MRLYSTIIVLIFSIIVIPFVPIVSVIGWQVTKGVFLRTQGYFPAAVPDDLIERIVRGERKPEDCKKFVRLSAPWAMGPTEGEQQDLCIYKVAQALKDAEVCELLMPSEYGLSCIGGIWGKEIDQSNCHWYDTNAIRCFIGPSLTPKIVQCSIEPKGTQPDECWHRVAFAKKNVGLCSNIQNLALQKVCMVRTAAWLKYPDLRAAFYFGRNTREK